MIDVQEPMRFILVRLSFSKNRKKVELLFMFADQCLCVKKA